MILLSSWQDIVTQEANSQGCPVPIALATVEAESSGTNANGSIYGIVGYGQIYLKYHMDAVRFAEQKFGVSAPSDISSLISFMLNNDAFSLAVSVFVINQMWQSSGQSWSSFTYSYVGSGISSEDFARRQVIWNKYSNSSYDGAASGGSSGTGFGPQADIVLPKTNFEVVGGSGKLGDMLYGRRYRVIVSDLTGNKALDVSELRCVFNCIKVIQLQPQFSTIAIYNLSAETENTIINEGCRVVLEAGYEGEQYGVVFDGNVVQSIRNKEEGTTYTLTLVAADADMWMSYSLSAFSMVKGQNSRAALKNVASKATIPSQLGSISSSLSQSKLTRGKVFFGLTSDYVRQIARSENATAYVQDGKINIIKATDIPDGEIIDLSPATGLIGVPVQSEYGVTIKCLLNPKIKVNTLVHVDNSLVRNQQYEQGQPIYSLDHDGIYRVIKTTVIGDTRGNDWYTEVETVTQAGILPAMVANGTQSPW